jgi:CubicO group peptidase (beta-lactamase class C family)
MDEALLLCFLKKYFFQILIVKLPFLLILLTILVHACQKEPLDWNGAILTNPRQLLTAEELLAGKTQPLIDMSYFAQPDWSSEAKHSFSGTISFEDTKLIFPIERAYYPGENSFPKFEIAFLSHDGELIPQTKKKIITRSESSSLWDVIVGTGRVWHEKQDGEWSRASFPLTLTDRYVGQARNCVATFVYQADTISAICLQCSQETADIDDQQLGNINGTLPVTFQQRSFPDSAQIVDEHQRSIAERLPVHSLSKIDVNGAVADYFEQKIRTNAPTSLGAVLLDNQLYLHPPKTRHGNYPYPHEMRHGLYSVTKSMAGALALMYFEERYEERLFDALIVDYVPALADHEGWQGVTFAHALNMATGTVGSERSEHLYQTSIAAETAAEAIKNVAQLGNTAASPGQVFNYASTNFFVLSYALQQYVEAKEGVANYWDLVHENVLVPIGAEQFSLLHTIEDVGIPMLAFGALPTIDEAAKIALLFANEGSYEGQQLLSKERVQEVFGHTTQSGYSTNNDFRGDQYQHGFWSKKIKAGGCQVRATYMLGFGENYIVFLPSGAIIFRFLDEHDLNIDQLIKRVEAMASSC